jgi:multiple sugar transport system ATP-binding protein
MLRPWMGREVILGIRPEHIVDTATARTGEAARFNRRFPVELVEPTGPDTLVLVGINDKQVCCRVHPDQACAAGQSMELQFNLSKAVFFDPETEKRLA